jgi:hypothetical protein
MRGGSPSYYAGQWWINSVSLQPFRAKSWSGARSVL